MQGLGQANREPGQRWGSQVPREQAKTLCSERHSSPTYTHPQGPAACCTPEDWPAVPFQTFSQRGERRSRLLESSTKTPNNVSIRHPVSASESEIKLISLILPRLPAVAKQHGVTKLNHSKCPSRTAAPSPVPTQGYRLSLSPEAGAPPGPIHHGTVCPLHWGLLVHPSPTHNHSGQTAQGQTTHSHTASSTETPPTDCS